MSSLQEIPILDTQNNISIANIAIFSIPLVVRIVHIIRLSAVGHLEGPLLRSFLDRIIIFCLVRIIGSALYLAASSPTDSILIGALILDSLGATFFMLELVRLLVVYLEHAAFALSEPQRALHRGIQSLRIPILIGIVLLIVGYNVSNVTIYKALSRAGSLIFLAVFFAIAAVYAYMSVCMRHIVGLARTSFLLSALSLPFLFVRMLYVVLSAFGADNGAFRIIWGDWRIFVGMGLTTEVFIVGLLMASGFAEPPVLSRNGEPESVELGSKDPASV